MKGIKEVCSQSKNLAPVGYLPSIVLEVIYYPDEDRVAAYPHANDNSWTVFKDGVQYVRCGYLRHPATMAEIRDRVESAKD